MLSLPNRADTAKDFGRAPDGSLGLIIIGLLSSGTALGRKRHSLSSHFSTNTISSFGNVYITCISDEAQCVGKVIDMLLDANVVESQIGVITPYNEQRKVIKWSLPKGTNKKVN
eukprot:Em0007g801a